MKKLLMILCLLLMPSLIFAASNVTFEWDENPLGEQVIAYKIYQSQTTGVYNDPAAGEPLYGTPTITLNNIPDGTYYWVVTAYNQYGESDWSNEVTATLMTSPPGSPSNVVITIIVRVE